MGTSESMMSYKLYTESKKLVGTPFNIKELPKVKMRMGELAKYAKEHKKTYNEFSDEEKALFAK